MHHREGAGRLKIPSDTKNTQIPRLSSGWFRLYFE